MSYEFTLSEVRRISAGGKPIPIRRLIRIRRKVTQWTANAYVLRLLGEPTADTIKEASK
jgi:hypothetical protein